MSTLEETTIVMIDDDIDEIFLTRRQVRHSGIVNRFYSEKEPERIIETLESLMDMGVDQKSFFILLDIHMPRSNGFDTLKRIRSDDRFKEVPVIMLTGSKDEFDMFETFEHGGDGYIVKPFSSEEFFSAIDGINRVKKRLMQ